AREAPDVFWIGSAKGLFRCVLSRRPDGVVILKNLETFVNDRLEQSSLSSNKVNCIHIDKNGSVWIGTNLGLNRYDPWKKNFSHYFSVDGLPNEIINGILEDEQGTLWLSTNKGISRATRDNERLIFRNYDESDGLQSNEFNQGAFYKSVTGEMLFGGINGFNSFRPERVLDNPYIPQIALTQIKIGNRLLDNPTQLNTGTAEMDYSEGSVSFNFASLDFTNPRKNLYSYKLEGFDQDWSQPGTAPFAHYTNLDPGDYTFFVKGSNNDGIWNKGGTLIHLSVRPPYWMAWWFRFSVILLLLGLITIVVRYRLNRLLEMERLRTRIASDLHDEIGSSFTTITMYAAALQNENEVEKIVQKSKKIEEFSRAIIGSLSDVVWSIDSRNDSAGDLLDRIKDFLNISFGESTCRFSLTVHGIDEKKKLEVGSRQNVYLIFKETITNIVKHSTASFVEITLNNSAESGFIMTIRDNGTGFTATEKKQGNGLRNMKARAEKIGGTIQIVSDNGVFVQLKTKKI
ncbi:MAG: hypothetical protein HYV28_21005, partial [Ignavibacteriales bacterium]|nr:hypothetical protein [Ignavibacteriales bacterium]